MADTAFDDEDVTLSTVGEGVGILSSISSVDSWSRS